LAIIVLPIRADHRPARTRSRLRSGPIIVLLGPDRACDPGRSSSCSDPIALAIRAIVVLLDHHRASDPGRSSSRSTIIAHQSGAIVVAIHPDHTEHRSRSKPGSVLMVVQEPRGSANDVS
jgi:hypothetical protein